MIDEEIKTKIVEKQLLQKQQEARRARYLKRINDFSVKKIIKIGTFIFVKRHFFLYEIQFFGFYLL